MNYPMSKSDPYKIRGLITKSARAEIMARHSINSSSYISMMIAGTRYRAEVLADLLSAAKVEAKRRKITEARIANLKTYLNN